jgi:hypothetical protein
MTKKVLTIVIDERVEGLEPLGSAVSALEYDGFIVEEYSIHEYGVSIMSKLQKHIERLGDGNEDGNKMYVDGMKYALSILKGGN